MCVHAHSAASSRFALLLMHTNEWDIWANNEGNVIKKEQFYK